MKYLKLFERYKVDEIEYPENGHNLSSREEIVLKKLVGDYYLNFKIKKDDGYYYTSYNYLYQKFDNLTDLKDYIQFRYFILYNDPNKFLELYKVSKLDMSFDDNESIGWASIKGHTEIVKILLEDPRVDPSDRNNLAIRLASENGHIEIVKLLLKDPRVDPSDYNNYAIIYASTKGHAEIVKLLLADPRVDPSAENNLAIRWAVVNCHKEVVKLLLQDPRVDPSDGDNSAIKRASNNRHKEIVKLLLEDPRVRAKLSPREINKYLNEIS